MIGSTVAGGAMGVGAFLSASNTSAAGSANNVWEINIDATRIARTSSETRGSNNATAPVILT